VILGFSVLGARNIQYNAAAAAAAAAAVVVSHMCYYRHLLTILKEVSRHRPLFKS
jgi:preprotein translocase subunit SecD